ncbi:Lar family restriction alleviation protein [Phyllobacterium calauticae]|jgi:Lar family restriction alleviation protein|uniref:Lar family restriction alleviation protein n=1 Tax=Phyllobacterium calauticae TaxID=2817027 RepID=UPI001CBE502E|nr:Lar family restriction alleviation protein [Phyllobacterium calauticae]MBZ3691033.1 Lar family restriction alleviation protein [Phyllobacterium calauticae]
MTDTALKPCPFCGGEGYIQNHIDLMFFASCRDCYCCVGEGYDRDAMPEHLFNTEEAAREAWNTRAAPAAGPLIEEERR